MTFLTGHRLAAGRLRFVPLIVLGSSTALLEIRLAKANSNNEFQASFMRQSPDHAADAGAMALAALANRPDVGPGRYWVDIQVNSRFFGHRELQFEASPDGERLLPCLSASLLEEFGVRLESLAEPISLQQTCVDLAGLIPSAKTELDGSALRLDVSIPQIVMRRDMLGQIDPEHWDYGINAAFVNYQASAQQGSSNHSGSTSSQDLYFNSGLNLGPWRLRSNQSLRQDEYGGRSWSRAYAYAQRDLPGMNANLTLGETSTPGDAFKVLPLKGVVLRSDQGMLPDVLQGYAPVIRGVALSRAKLEILQNGYPIYSTYVSAGPYEIDDLSTAGGSGELEIVLTEADGQVRRFTQPYATLGNLLREGTWRYSASVGRYYTASNLEEPLLWQGTLALGTDWGSTLYGGLMASDFYRAGNAGIGKDLGAIGALSFDVTHSAAEVDTSDASSTQGMSYAIKYGKAFQSRTNLRFAGYRYSTEGYRDFDEAVRQRSRDSAYHGSRRSRLEASVFQNIGKQSSLNLTLSQEDYWRSDYERRQFQFNFNTHHQGISYNLFASQSLSDRNGSSDRQMGLSVSMPVDFGRSSTATFDLQKSANTFSQRASLSGTADDSQLNYRASLARDDLHQQSASLAVGYQIPQGSLGAGVTQGNDYRSVSLNASGALLLHSDGLELGPYLGETAGLVEVPGIAGVGIANASGVRTNERGYALVPYLRPYRVNRIELETDQLGPEIEIDNGTSQVVPRRGAVVKTRFDARKIQRLLITGHTTGGLPLPFGAHISNSEGETIGVVGQAGQFMLATSAEPQRLDVRWGDEVEQSCQLNIDPQTMDEAQGYRLQQVTCI
ncbi:MULTISPECIES: fimbria/pilus outer membrane usher protein [Pseudomonas]|uniref:fimbria/pilus outer membrane usher protein n=1 Tax=Pseudomonas TaxID=286 RepID=UPI000CFF7313|nr:MULTISPECIES: fimbria/pilus outer membrane usher protein [Pseudomonas]PRA44893.1 ferrous iron transporter B [Pseudomonas sp. MYb115]QXN52765.1 fimbrial biogenesis outer membrane usher protein [Pseudomonas fluorescens]WSO27108.1 fimbria/pilus outer membrane usher protein [Pseudomonas fluorescens]